MSGCLAILGPGTLGRSLARWAVDCGLMVRLLGRDEGHAARGCAAVAAQWEAEAARGRHRPGDLPERQARLIPGAFHPGALTGADWFLEALPESPEVKAPALAQAAAWGGADMLLCTGTSSIPVSDLAHRSGTAGRLVGFHLFVPVARMAVVELAVAPGTAAASLEAAQELAGRLRKRVVQVRDQPGFAAARMGLALGLEAMRLVEAGVASAEDLDALMTLGYGHPVGPLALSDRVGLDLRLAIARRLEAAGEARFAPPPLLQSLVDQGLTGRKAGQGFHAWPSPPKETP